MKTDRAKPVNIDEYIAAAPPEVRAILRKIRGDNPESSSCRGGEDQLSNSNVHPQRQPGSFRRFPETHRLLPSGQRQEGQGRGISLCRRKGQSEVPNRRANSLRLDQQDCEGPREREPGTSRREEESITPIAPILSPAARRSLETSSP